MFCSNLQLKFQPAYASPAVGRINFYLIYVIVTMALHYLILSFSFSSAEFLFRGALTVLSANLYVKLMRICLVS